MASGEAALLGGALLQSRSTFGSIGQRYKIYSDRLELPSRMLLRTFTIPFSDIVEIWVARPVVVGEMFRGRGFWSGFALKLDFADLYTHVGLERSSGWFHHIHFTPDAPERFVAKCRERMRYERE